MITSEQQSNSYGAVDVHVCSDEESQQTELLTTTYQNDGVGCVANLPDGFFESVKFDAGGQQDHGGTATIFSEVMNISKNLLGAGVLSMSGGIAMYASNPWAVLSGSFWIVLQAAIFGYFCIVIAKVCKFTKSKTIRECWEKTMGDRFAVAIVVVIGLNPLQGTLAYSSILSQTFRSLSASLNVEFTHVESLLVVTIFGLLPLCLMKNIDALAPFSILGTASVLLTALGMIYRCLDGSYSPDGIYYHDLSPKMRPSFGDYNEPFSMKVMPLVCMIFEAYVMHYNSPRFYMELKDRSIPRFTRCVGGAFGLSASVYVAIASAGFLTFGANSDTYILNNYSHKDPVATICRLLVGISVLTIYPMAFIGVRDAVLDVIKIPVERQTNFFLNALTVALLSLITFTAVFVTDLGVINSVGGGSVAVMMCFVFPALMFQKTISGLGSMALDGQHVEVKVVMLLMTVGCIIGIAGVATELALYEG
ncbi:Putative sodium-coupled neutral amino acid transporter 11 [Seminavis robusta]|uniref:Sodium-coupled neutral amino acid transporter 11 n=1 Tax=Seminavis robusta TaxID=568900 RepID=A0A9N8DAX7_9STRA|nr:Putative sodium-coupled neutral amino acid transporter 11 [Seminavis robusta]|eukprot:Sro63_g035740.1 Putative sodium-coupled neutral amino acid transporter 11 (478) ;mRNA; r:45396-47037